MSLFSQQLKIVSSGIHFGIYPVKYLETASLEDVQKLNQFCESNGYTTGWEQIPSTEFGTMFRMTKIPFFLLYSLSKEQPTDKARECFIGTWPISVGYSGIALNIITNIIQNDTLEFHKFTMFVPEYSLKELLNRQIPMNNPLENPSFRTSIFKGQINESREYMSQCDFPDMIINKVEDTIYPDSRLPLEEKKKVIQKYVQYMKKNYSNCLQSSYYGNDSTVLEDEFALMQQYINF